MRGGTSSATSSFVREGTKRSESATYALRRLFGWIEEKFGGIPFDKGEAGEIVTIDDVSKLNGDVLLRLFEHRATGLHVKNFYNKHAAKELGKRLAVEAESGQGKNWKVSTSRGLESSDVFTLGAHDPYNVASASNDPADIDAYFDGVLQEFENRRLMVCEGASAPSTTTSTTSTPAAATAVPQLWPLDLLRLRLDERWPYGAGLAKEEEGSSGGSRRRCFSGGLPRVMLGPTRWKQGYIHVDEMGPLNAKQGLFSANIYLQLPPPSSDENEEEEHAVSSSSYDAQNIIDIWPVGIRSRWDWYRNALLLSGLSSQDVESQVRLRHVLGTPCTVAVEPGDLVLLCVQRPHAAVGFKSGTRVSLQCFIQYSGHDQRLLIDS